VGGEEHDKNVSGGHRKLLRDGIHKTEKRRITQLRREYIMKRVRAIN